MLNLNGVDIPSFVKVNIINFSVLPPIENNLLKVRGKMGFYNMGQDFGQRVIRATITIHSDKVNGVMTDTRKLAEWLYHKEPVKLVINDEPEKYYLVMPDGNTDIAEMYKFGRGVIQFVCVEPFAFGEEKVLNFSPETSEHVMQVTVEGSTETYPKIELTVKEETSSFTIISDDSFIMLGQPAFAETVAVKEKETRLWDEMVNPATWTTAISVDNGKPTGTFASNGYDFYVSDYGAGYDEVTAPKEWHGASGIKSLPSPIKDFEVRIDIGTITGKFEDEGGRIELYLLDENNVQFGKVALIDDYRGRTFQARAGQYKNGGVYFAHEKNRKNVWANMNGFMLIGRRGNHWFTNIQNYSQSQNRWHSGLYETYNDTKGLATNNLAKIQIHIGKFSNTASLPDARIKDIKVKEFMKLTENQVPNIAEVGDILTIDCEKAIVFKNGLPFYEALNPSSEFFSLKKGINGLVLTPPNANMEVSFTERWL